MHIIHDHTLLLTYKALQNFTHLSISDLLHKPIYASCRNLPSLSNEHLAEPRSKTSMLQKSFAYNASKQSNNLTFSLHLFILV